MLRGRAWVVILFLLAIMLSPLAFIALAFWVASGSWEFEGTGIRHWLLVKGSTLEQLGIVSPTDGPPRYVVRIQEGTDPGARSVAYDSSALPSEVIAAYAERCHAMDLAIKKQEADERTTKAVLVCEGNPDVPFSDDVWVSAERDPGATTTSVGVTTGPGLTLTYGF